MTRFHAKTSFHISETKIQLGNAYFVGPVPLGTLSCLVISSGDCTTTSFIDNSNFWTILDSQSSLFAILGGVVKIVHFVGHIKDFFFQNVLSHLRENLFTT